MNEEQRHSLRSSAMGFALQIVQPRVRRNQAEEAAHPSGDWQEVIRAARDIADFLENG